MSRWPSAWDRSAAIKAIRWAWGTLELAKSVSGLKAVGVADPRRIEPEHLRAAEVQIEQNRDMIVALKA